MVHLRVVLLQSLSWKYRFQCDVNCNSEDQHLVNRLNIKMGRRSGEIPTSSLPSCHVVNNKFQPPNWGEHCSSGSLAGHGSQVAHTKWQVSIALVPSKHVLLKRDKNPCIKQFLGQVDWGRSIVAASYHHACFHLWFTAPWKEYATKPAQDTLSARQHKQKENSCTKHDPEWDTELFSLMLWY